MRKGNLLVAKQNQVKRINESKIWAEVFVDIMNAFDTVDHDILIHRINVAVNRGCCSRLVLLLFDRKNAKK